jgi:hypothetical protein
VVEMLDIIETLSIQKNIAVNNEANKKYELKTTLKRNIELK